MNHLRMLLVACVATLAVALPATAQDKSPPAQKKEAPKSTADNPSSNYRFVSGDETLTSGDAVSVTRKGAGKVTGTFVYSDPKSNKVFIRSQAGQPPVAVPAGEIEKIERITPAAGSPGKGSVRPAFEAGEKAALRYEIHTMTVRNGPSTNTFFYDSTLSPAEREQLRALENANNDVLQHGSTIESLREAIQNAANDTGVSVVQAGGGYPAYVPLYPYYYPVAYYNLYYYLYYPMLPFAAYDFGGPFGGYYGGYGGGGNSTVVIRDSGSSAQSLAALTKSLSEAQAALVTAQKNAIAMSHRAVYDADGRIVAVRLEE
jgi:hypothetical protein